MRFFIKKLGCPKNDVDGDFLAGYLISRGHEYAADDGAADVVIVNTCGFILPAREESVEEILYYEKMKKEGKIKKLYITGCLAERYSSELRKELPCADGIFGLNRASDIGWAMEGKEALVGGKEPFSERGRDFPEPQTRFVNQALPYEYLKISEGCDRFCSYCAIPLIRGRYRSRPMEQIIEEAEFLARKGKKELILVSQEGTGYGRDFGDGKDIVNLLERLEKIDDIKWIKLMYLHPEAITDRLIEHISFSPKMGGYFDIPLQHINDDILRRMNRNSSRADIETLLGKIRSVSSSNLIRTSLIVGFPGETEEQFQELLEFTADFEFDRLGVFKYSQEEGTVAGAFPDQVPEDEKERRSDEIMSLQQEIAFKKNIALIDAVQKVIIDRIISEDVAEGRTRGDCPEIDQIVYIKSGRLKAGDFADAKIIMADGYDLIARTVGDNYDKV
jgi:ribosomal protein S12 methylthiotransferase